MQKSKISNLFIHFHITLRFIHLQLKMYQEDKLMSCSHSFKIINRVFTLVLEVSVGSCMNQSE